MCATRSNRRDNEGRKLGAARTAGPAHAGNADRAARGPDKNVAYPARAARRAALRVEPVDNWHVAWSKVLKLIEATGSADKLQIDADGWLSARQVLMIAFAGDAPAAHVCFSVSPSRTGCVQARLDTFGIAPKFCGRGIESQLHRAASERAHALGCDKRIGFGLGSDWC